MGKGKFDGLTNSGCFEIVLKQGSVEGEIRMSVVKYMHDTCNGARGMKFFTCLGCGEHESGNYANGVEYCHRCVGRIGICCICGRKMSDVPVEKLSLMSAKEANEKTNKVVYKKYEDLFKLVDSGIKKAVTDERYFVDIDVSEYCEESICKICAEITCLGYKVIKNGVGIGSNLIIISWRDE